jgi:hypothetical protein
MAIRTLPTRFRANRSLLSTPIQRSRDLPLTLTRPCHPSFAIALLPFRSARLGARASSLREIDRYSLAGRQSTSYQPRENRRGESERA